MRPPVMRALSPAMLNRNTPPPWAGVRFPLTEPPVISNVTRRVSVQIVQGNSAAVALDGIVTINRSAMNLDGDVTRAAHGVAEDTAALALGIIADDLAAIHEQRTHRPPRRRWVRPAHLTSPPTTYRHATAVPISNRLVLRLTLNVVSRVFNRVSGRRSSP